MSNKKTNRVLQLTVVIEERKEQKWTDADIAARLKVRSTAPEFKVLSADATNDDD